MAGNTERDSEAMHQFVREWENYSQEISAIARNLQSCCSSAKGSLRDEVTGRLIDQIEQFAETLVRTVQQGDEPVRELERSAKTLDELEEIR